MVEAHPETNERTVYLNGAIVPESAARLPLDDHGVLYGLGFFETFRTSGGRPHGWAQHRRRLRHACDVAGIELPPSFLAADEARLNEVVRAQLAGRGMADAAFRYTVTAGVPSGETGYARYGRPSEWLTLRPLPPEPAQEGVALRLLAIRRDAGEWLPRPKSLNFTNALLGARELQRRGAAIDDEGLFLAREGGHVVETVRHNVAWLSGGRWLYPDPALGAVAGTGLEWLLDQGVAAEPCRARPEDLVSAEAVVVINSVRGITPARALWDAGDRALFGSWASHAHPQVIDVRRRWRDALRATAGGR